MTGRSTIVTAGAHYVFGIINHSSAQTNANVFSGMQIHDILNPQNTFPGNSPLCSETHSQTELVDAGSVSA